MNRNRVILIKQPGDNCQKLRNSDKTPGDNCQKSRDSDKTPGDNHQN